jgi:hypothetical protein
MPEQRFQNVRVESASRRRPDPRRHAPKAADIDTEVQEELSGEVVALSTAVVTMLQERGYVAAPDLTEEVALEATELILFAAMNCAHSVIDSVARVHADQTPRRRRAAAANGRRRVG